MKRPIAGSMCRTIQGQEGCRDCASGSRVCETCSKRPVCFPQYGLCFTCSVNELGEGWKADNLDRAVAYPPPRVVAGTAAVTREPGKEIIPLAQELRRIPLANIRDPQQSVRTVYDEEELLNLGDSMLNDGMIYPVVVEPVDENFYEVVIGSRRVRAARYKNQLDIPALILEPQSALTKLLSALAENIQRVQLDPFEEARNFLRLMREFKLEMSDISEKINKPTSYIRERLKIISLPEETQALVRSGELSLQKAALFVRVPDESKQSEMAQESVAHRFDQGELRRRITTAIGTSESETPRVIPYFVTPQKLAARSEEFARWFKRVVPRLKLNEINFAERTLIHTALNALEGQVRLIRGMLAKENIPPLATTKSSGNLKGPADAHNHREEWSVTDINRIIADNRPSDDILAKDLGRTPGAVAGMRALTKKRKKSKRK